MKKIPEMTPIFCKECKHYQVRDNVHSCTKDSRWFDLECCEIYKYKNCFNKRRSNAKAKKEEMHSMPKASSNKRKR